MQARVRFVRPRVTILRPEENGIHVFQPRGHRQISHTVLGTCVNKSNRLAFFDVHARFENIHDQTVTCAGREKEMERLLKGFDG